MKKTFLIFLTLISCSKEIKNSSKENFDKIVLKNKTDDSFGGFRKDIILEIKDYQHIDEQLKIISKNPQNNVQVNYNYGYIEALLYDSKNNKSEYYFDIIITPWFGDIIRYESQYFYNDHFVEKIYNVLELNVNMIKYKRKIEIDRYKNSL